MATKEDKSKQFKEAEKKEQEKPHDHSKETANEIYKEITGNDPKVTYREITAAEAGHLGGQITKSFVEKGKEQDRQMQAEKEKKAEQSKTQEETKTA
jgi:hypothetical protein